MKFRAYLALPQAIRDPCPELRAAERYALVLKIDCVPHPALPSVNCAISGMGMLPDIILMVGLCIAEPSPVAYFTVFLL